MRDEDLFTMNQTDGGIGGRGWIWIMVGTLVVVLIVVIVSKLFKK